jgi:hypothetical protein
VGREMCRSWLFSKKVGGKKEKGPGAKNGYFGGLHGLYLAKVGRYRW